MTNNIKKINIDLETKPDFDQCMERINAWYEQKVVDRAPIRFSAHNEEYSESDSVKGYSWNTLKERWWNTDYQLALFEHQLNNSVFNAETFPIYWPNLGPEVYSAFYGLELEYQEITSYAIHNVHEWSDIDKLKFDMNNPYFKKIEEMTYAALERCKGKFLVGYTDLHPGMDCAAGFRHPEQLCMDTIMDTDMVRKLIDISSKDFQMIYDYFDKILKDNGQPSVAWMGIPSYGKMHIPSCDFSSMLAPEQFIDLILPSIQEEVKPMDHNIFHLDGKGVANHIDAILEMPEINAIQWAQGVGDDQPIMQWVPFIKKIQAAGKSVVVDLAPSELDDFMQEVSPEGILLCIASEASTQKDIISKVEKWTK